MNNTIRKPLVNAIAACSVAGMALVSSSAMATVTAFTDTFEGLPVSDGGTALSDLGWRIGANVYDGTVSPYTDGFKFFFGLFLAPNGGPGFSSVATGDGHPGAIDASGNYMNIYSDYNCCDLDPPGNEQGHGNGTDVVNALVLKEFNITSDDIGKQVVFSFDVKRPEFQDDGFGGDTSAAVGNGCGGPTDLCEASAFVKTLDPGAGFATTNEIVEDTTAVSQGAWTTVSITLDLTDPLLDGQLLQVGFQSVAQDFNNTGVYYDNVDLTVNTLAAPVAVPVPAAALALLAGVLGATVAVRRTAAVK